MIDSNSEASGKSLSASQWTEYLIRCGCASDRPVSLLFEDGTGATGTPAELGAYLERRYRVLEDSFEIMFLDDEDLNEYHELYPPTEEGEAYDPSRRDPRF